MNLVPHIENFRRRFAEVEALLSDAKVFDRPQTAQELAREYGRLKDLVAAGTAYVKTVADLEENRALLKAEPAESELAVMAREEIARLEADEKRLGHQIHFGLVPPDPTDSRNTIMEIRAGAGDESACSPRIFTGCTVATRKRAGGRWKPLIAMPRTWAVSRKLSFRSTAPMFTSG